MPDRWAVASGNWSNTATWNGGTLPGAGDDVFADGFTVTIDQDVTVLSIRNTQRAGGTLGGTFTLQAGRTVSATGTGFVGGGGVGISCINFTSSGSPSVLNGNCQSTGAGPTVNNNTSNNTLTINGNITSSSGYTISCTSNGTTIMNGTVSGANCVSTGGNIFCLVTINGNVTAGSTSNNHAVSVGGVSQVHIIGNVTGGSGSGSVGAFVNAIGATLTVTGNVNAGSGAGISRSGGGGFSGNIIVNGNVTGGGLTTNTTWGISAGGVGFVTVNGNVTAGTGSGGACHGIGGMGNNALNILTITGDITSTNFGIGVNLIGPELRHYGSLISAPNGTFAVIGFVYTVSASAQQTFRPRVVSTLAERILYTSNAMPSSVSPLAADVRSGVSYANGERTGTCAVPPAGSVAFGVPVDNTTGTGLINQTVLQAALEAALAPNAANIVERSTNDNKAITFSWPVSGATITGQKSIDNGAYSAVAGAITFLRTESNRHYYALAYNAADRASVESSIRYMMTDGTYTKYFNLKINPPGITQPEIRTAVGLASANLDTQLTGISTKTNQLTFTNANQVDARTVSFNANAITSSALASSAVDEIVDAVYDEPMSGHTVNGTYGSHLVRSANQNQNTVQITGSQHIAADMHESQVGAIHTTTFDAGAITSTVLATDCITSDELAASAIAEIAAAASVTVNVTPLQAVVNQLVNGTRVETFIGFTGTVGPITVTDTNNNPVNLSAPCEIIISKKWRGDILVIPNASITRSGAGNNQFSFSASGATLIPGEHAWALRRLSDNFVFAYGDWIVKQAAKKD